MRGLNLGLGTTKTLTAAAAAGAVTWEGYDGTNNNVQAGFITSDYDRFAAAAQSDTAMLLVTGSGSTLEAYRVTRSGATLTLGSALATITNTGYAYCPQLVKMTSTRYLLIAADLGDADYRIYLLDEDGATIDTLTTTSNATETSATQHFGSLTRHSDTVAVFSYRNAGNQHYCVAIDIASDTISQGTAVRSTTSTANAHLSVTALTETTGVALSVGVVWLYSLSGTSLTFDDSLTLNGTPGGAGLTSDIVKIDDTHALAIMQDTTISTNAHVFGWMVTNTGGTLSGSAYTQFTSGTPSGFDNQMFTNAVPVRSTDGVVDQVLFCNSTNDGGQGLKTLVVEINTSDYSFAVGSGGIVNVDTSDDLEENALFPFQESGYAVSFAEDTVASQVQATVLAP